MRRLIFVLGFIAFGLPAIAEEPGWHRLREARERIYARHVSIYEQVPLNTVIEVEPHHASTVRGDWLRGEAGWLRSYGMYLYLESQSAIAWQQARELDIRNRIAAVQAWHEMRLLLISAHKTNQDLS